MFKRSDDNTQQSIDLYYTYIYIILYEYMRVYARAVHHKKMSFIYIFFYQPILFYCCAHGDPFDSLYSIYIIYAQFKTLKTKIKTSKY